MKDSLPDYMSLVKDRGVFKLWTPMKGLQSRQFPGEQRDIKRGMTVQLKELFIHSLGQLQTAEPVFKRQVLFKIKKDIMAQLDDLKIAEVTKSYLLHQLANVHSDHELSQLIHDINS